jgi:hypothetical protein
MDGAEGPLWIYTNRFSYSAVVLLIILYRQLWGSSDKNWYLARIVLGNVPDQSERLFFHNPVRGSRILVTTDVALKFIR